MNTTNTQTGAGNTTAAQVNELLNTLMEIELLARDIKRSVCADAIVCKCIDVLAKYPKPTPGIPAQPIDAAHAIYCDHNYNNGPLVCYVHDIREAALIAEALGEKPLDIQHALDMRALTRTTSA